MKNLRSRLLLAAALALPAGAWAQPNGDFAFGVISQAIKSPNDTAILEQALAESDADSLAFVAADGIKRTDESCSDTLYSQRFNLLSAAKNGVVVVLAGSDWADCRGNGGKLDAMARLARLRELYFPDEFSLGASKIPLIRQSITPKFRIYVENARWEVGNVLFTSLDLPAENNRYRTEAGRNGEFEDRAIATREWLHRSFINAKLRNMAAIVLICDGNPLAVSKGARADKRDGFAEVRQQLMQLAAKFPGKVLLIHNGNAGKARAIAWRGNLGELELGNSWTRVGVKIGARGGNAVQFSATMGGEAAEKTGN